MKVIHLISMLLVVFIVCTVNAIRTNKNSAAMADLKKRSERFLAELEITADEYKTKIKEIKKNNPDKAEILQNIHSRIQTLKTKNETIDLDRELEELTSFIKPEHLKVAKNKLIQIRSHIHDLNRTAFNDLKEWSDTLLSESHQLWT